MDIVKYKEKPTLEFAKQIFALYFNGKSSELEVNIPKFLLDAVHEEIKAGIVRPDLYDTCQIQVEVNLFDTFSRLILTDEYKKFKEETNFIKTV